MSFVRKLAFVYDTISEDKCQSLMESLKGMGVKFFNIGAIPISTDETEDAILSSLYSIIENADIVLGVSSSGNGIAIYANKIEGFIAAPIGMMSDIDEAISVFSANTFDISMYNRNLFNICMTIVERTGLIDEMEQ